MYCQTPFPSAPAPIVYHQYDGTVDTFRMAALIKAANAKIRSNPVLDYVCSTRTYMHIFLSDFEASPSSYIIEPQSLARAFNTQ